MKNNLLTFIACMSFSLGIAQSFKTEKSGGFEKANENTTYHIAFPSAYGFMTYSYLENVFMDNTKAITLTKYDQSMKAIESQTFNLPKLGLRAAHLIEVVELEDKLVFLSNCMDKKTGEHQLYAQVYNKEKNTISEKKVLATFAIEGYSKSGFYQVSVSPDRTKIGIFANMPFVKKTQEKVKVWLYASDLSILWEQSETINFDSKKAYQEITFVNNAGDLFLSKVTDFYKSKSRTTHLAKFDGKSVETTILSSDGFQPMNMKIIEVSGKTMLSGFFWDGKFGSVSTNTDKESSNHGVFLYDLSDQKLLGKHTWSKDLDTSTLKSLAVIDCKVTGEDVYLIGERHSTKSEFIKTGSSTSTDMNHFYTFGSGVVAHFDATGTLKGFNNISGTHDYKNSLKERGSIAVLELKDGLHIFRNNSSLKHTPLFADQKETFQVPSVRPNGGTPTQPYLIPATFKAVDDYNLAYFITNYGDQYWFNKMSW